MDAVSEKERRSAAALTGTIPLSERPERSVRGLPGHMGHPQLPSYECLPFVDPPQQHVAEEDGPDPVVDFFQTDTMLLESGRQVQQPSLETNGARVGGALREEVARILERRQPTRVRAGRGPIERAGRPAVEKLMGPLVVVLLAEALEGPLLRRERGAWGANGPALQRLVHALVGAILLRMGGQNPLVLNAQAQPPHVERRESMQRRRCERHTVVGAN